jgi:hypothetical protein
MIISITGRNIELKELISELVLLTIDRYKSDFKFSLFLLI